MLPEDVIRKLEELKPMYRVDSVVAESPASTGGLRAGDVLLQFGSVTKSTQPSKSVATEVGENVGKRVRVVIWRNGEGMLLLDIIPNQWEGRGLLGCHLVEYGQSTTTTPSS